MLTTITFSIISLGHKYGYPNYSLYLRTRMSPQHHRTNIVLPGMKLGSNFRTGGNWTLTFTLSWEPIDGSSQRLMIGQRGQC